MGQPTLQIVKPVGLAQLLQTLDQPVQRPDIVRVPGTALQRVVETQIGAEYLLCLGELALFRQKRRQSVARRVHPGPGFGVFKGIVAPNTFAQMLEGLIKIALVIGKFALGHHFPDPEDGVRRARASPRLC